MKVRGGFRPEGREPGVYRWGHDFEDDEPYLTIIPKRIAPWMHSKKGWFAFAAAGDVRPTRGRRRR